MVAGAFDSIYGLGSTVPVRRRGQVTRRDLLLQVAELDRWSRSTAAAARKAGAAPPRGGRRARPGGHAAAGRADRPGRRRAAASRPPVVVLDDVRSRQARQSQAPAAPEPVDVQLALDLGDAPEQTVPSGLPEMSRAERVRAELDVLGLDVSSHVMDAYAPFLDELGTTRARDLLGCRSRQEVLVAGVKVATQTPPIRSGRRVIFVTLDDATGPLDATFFEDAQVGYATTVFHSWLLVVQGLVRRTGPRGVSMQAVGCWELPPLHAAWLDGGLDAVWALMATPALVTEAAVQGAAASRSSRPVMTSPPLVGGGAGHSGVGGAVHVYATGFRASPVRRHQAGGRRHRHLAAVGRRRPRRASSGTPARGARADETGARRAPDRSRHPVTTRHTCHSWSRLHNDVAPSSAVRPVRGRWCRSARAAQLDLVPGTRPPTPRARDSASCRAPPLRAPRRCPSSPPSSPAAAGRPVLLAAPAGGRRRRTVTPGRGHRGAGALPGPGDLRPGRPPGRASRCASSCSAAYPGTGDSGIVRACTAAGASEHKEGRAWDWRVTTANPTHVAAGRRPDQLAASRPTSTATPPPWPAGSASCT